MTSLCVCRDRSIGAPSRFSRPLANVFLVAYRLACVAIDELGLARLVVDELGRAWLVVDERTSAWQSMRTVLAGLFKGDLT